MPVRLATPDDIAFMHAIRLGVRENALRDPARVTLDDYRVMLDIRGCGWVYEDNGKVVAFGVADRLARNIWALFVAAEFEARGIGQVLLRTMVEWLFAQSSETIWLTTEPHTRASRFYRAGGWREAGITGSGEMRFELQAPGDV